MRGLKFFFLASAFATGLLTAQEAVPPAAVSPQPAPVPVTLEPGTHIPLSLINSVSTKHSVVGDRVYLQTAFPILSAGRIVVPAGSYVMGTVTELKRAGRVKGRAELFLRFDSLTLPNGVVRDFRARLSNIDAQSDEKLDRKEGKIEGDGNKGGDLKTVAETAAAGASLGAIVGAAEHSVGKGVGIGAGAGAAAGLLGVLLTRGPDAVLAQGSTVEMVLDRQLTFDPDELNFGVLQPLHVAAPASPSSQAHDGRRRLPF